jgi:hypothetical protein
MSCAALNAPAAIMNFGIANFIDHTLDICYQASLTVTFDTDQSGCDCALLGDLGGATESILVTRKW